MVLWWMVLICTITHKLVFLSKQKQKTFLITELEAYKQPFRGILKKRCCENIKQIYRRTPTPKNDFNKVAIYQFILKLNCRPLAFTSYKALLKNRRGLELVSLAHFLHDFWRKVFLLFYTIDWLNFFAWLPLLRDVFVLQLFVNHLVTSQILKLTTSL